MAVTVFKDAKLLVGGYDLSGVLNNASLSYSVEMLDSTTFGDLGKRRKPGLEDVSANLAGFWDSTKDTPLFTNVGGSDVLSTLASSGTAGSNSYFFLSSQSTYNPGGQVGQLLGFSVATWGNTILVNGKVFENGAKTSTGNGGLGLALPAVASGQKLYAGLHVVGVSGTSSPTITVAIESDGDSTFATPVDRITFDPVTAVGSQYKTFDGPITDTQYRAKWTVSGTSPSFLIFLSIAVR